MVYEGNIRMRRNGLKRTETLNFKILGQNSLYSFIFFLEEHRKNSDTFEGDFFSM